ncbi:MAG TPA: SPOR domain-containing protein [Terriglobia bacterium]|nr:SPOR domain-containing protein [Terriglobia bacterium]
MGHESSPEQAVKGLSAGQMVLLFLAGAAVCAIFFSAGFVVGYNEKSSKAAPLTEQVSDSAEIPPVITPEQPRPSSQAGRAAPKIQTLAASGDHPEPLRPRPLSAPSNQAPDSPSKYEVESRLSPAMGPANSSVVAAVNNAASSRGPAGDAGPFMIQVAATGTKPDADKLVKALKSLNYPAVLLTPEQARAGDNLFRIQVGPFSTRESAEKTKAKLMQDGFKQPFIKH